MKVQLLVLGFIVMLFTSCPPNILKVPPAPGTLDSSFGTSGKVVTDYRYYKNNQWYSAYLEINAIAIQPDGKIVAGGSIELDSKDFILARYNANGSLDTNFGTNGFVIKDFSNDIDYAQAVAIQPDGKIVVGGIATNSSGNKDFAVARYLPNGTLDSGFGINGMFMQDLNSSQNDSLYGIALQADGKIILGGYTENNVALVRLTSTGALDTTFDTDGIMLKDVSGLSWVSSIAIDGNENIVVCGTATNVGTPSFVVLRYKNDGTLDTSFGTNGMTYTEFSGKGVSANALAIQADNSIVVAGTTTSSSSPGNGSYYAIARYTVNGQPDTSFNGTGTVEMFVDSDQEHNGISGIKIQTDGKLVVCGNKSNKCALARFNGTGSLDTAFGIDGFVNFTDLPVSALYALAIQPDGKIVAGGYMNDQDSGTDNFILYRVWP